MSRRLNWDTLPLHKPEAYSRVLEMARPCLLKIVEDIPIASEDVMVFDLRGHTYCCGSERGSFHR